MEPSNKYAYTYDALAAVAVAAEENEIKRQTINMKKGELKRSRSSGAGI
jgi:hypothetical protein